MSRRGPFDDIERVFDRMSEELDRLGEQVEGGAAPAPASADVVETDDAVVVRVDLPGYEADEIDLTVDDRLLTVTADREESTQADAPDGRYHRRERSRRSRSRRLRLPADVRGHEADAEYEHGVLTVTLPKEDSGGGGTRIDVA